ncbi:hypothetical protein BJ875DRAFT_387950 [Amylocarpus encephaloides]|uniref:SET domain-containing protein n=1 Tax=Amylocarpus encephaloides TaxID=45428 RepID=A0A9P7Y9K6_9HELO|nr:hypothetical protein BJ875DRAFT_387950 [Amylocarpus encephaloides]
MDAHERFTEWSKAQGVEINAIAPHRFPGRGLGIVAKKGFKKGETLLKVPISALRTINTVPTPISESIGSITTHGLLAAELCLDTSSDREPWNAVLPTMEFFLQSIPFMWDSKLQSHLPDVAKTLLSQQKTKMAVDWAAVSEAFPEVAYDDYVHRWLIVNTRTFYYLDPKIKKKPARDDCMALNPFADYFNHAATGCGVSFSSQGYTVTASQPIKAGSEIYISYGTHSNDFLLTEYGFLMTSNKWDEIPLDAYILPLLSTKQKGRLEEDGFLGKYVLDKETVCYRTQVALRMVCLPLRRWERFVEGMDDEESDQEVVDECLVKVLREYRRDAAEKVKKIQGLKSGISSQRKTLSERWKQIGALLDIHIDTIEF